MKSSILKAIFLFAAVASASHAADKAFLRQKTLEILDACSPEGSRIVRMGLKLASYSLSGDFTTLITGNDERACVTSINTIVHEENHGLRTFMGREVLKEKYGRFSDVFYNYDYSYLKNGQFTLIKKSTTFPSREMVPTIPERLRTYRFDTYIDTDNKLQTTQNEGIFGLLDEFNSYYQGTRAAFDLLPYYEKKGPQANWHDYFTGVNTTYYGCMEFKFYILKYLMFAKTRHQDNYNEIMNRKDLLYTFLEVEKNVSDLIHSYFDKKPLIYNRLRGYGWNVAENETGLTIVASGRSVSHMNFMNVYTLLDEEMKKPEYQSMMRTIEEKAEGYNPESVYGEVESDMKKMKMNDTEGGIREAEKPRPEDWLALEKGEGLNDLQMDFQDPLGDVGDSPADIRYPFIDLVHAFMTKTGSGLMVRMQFTELPESMPFNQSGVDDNQMEYQWSVLFDLDGNGTDDYSIDVIHFKNPGSVPVRGGLFENAQARLWKVKKDGASQVDVFVQGEKQGNEMVFEVSPCPFVSQVRKETRIRFNTYYTDGRKGAEDYLPD